ncbi:hypothetical protein SAMN05444487_11272 [Marininema mesophilum]|uniref:Uncharacterized protein n=1 Tax=Marininema mesophilum TaxID=1048340 RepID=A0A1H2ZZH2_9BACL|nr:hypothetical protein [Marininema mesophilum]SDX22922.1 hypothetical protein SAMN05444487_11272 [Marininema mesophilum]
MGSKPLEISQSEREIIVMCLNSREEKILDAMEDRFHEIVGEKLASRAEKQVRNLFNDWHSLNETRQLKERVHRVAPTEQEGHIKAVPK